MQALRSKGKRSLPARLKLKVSDDGGRTRERVWLKNEDNRVLWRLDTRLGARTPGKVYWVTVPKLPNGLGSADFCVRAWDAEGKASATSCALLDIS